MVELKTRPNDLSVDEFLNKLEDETKRNDSFELIKIMSKITKSDPVMWGPAIVGFGNYHYVYESGREGDWFLTGFSPRKQALSLYLMSGFSKHPDLMDALGKYKTGKGCIYIKRLSDIDLRVLTKLIEQSMAYLKNKL